MSQVEACFYPATMQNPNPVYSPAVHAAIKPDVSDSQESALSAVSSAYSAPKLPSSSSNLSSSTAAETDFTTPSSINVTSEQSKPTEVSMPTLPNQARGSDARAAASRLDTGAAGTLQVGNTTASPMCLDSPVPQGSKRTADGAVKGSGMALHSASRPFAAHKRNKSVDTLGGSRIGELSAQLKTRLSYAMVKVQNGWEKQSLEELEEVHSQRGSPSSAPSRSERLAFDSPSAFDRQRRPSGVSDNSDQIILSPASDPSRSHAVTPSLHWQQTRPTMSAAANLISVTGSRNGLSLAPAPDIETGRRRRSSISHPPPPLLGSTQKKHVSDLGAGSRTPVTPRAGILRMPSQQAEKDAVDTLLFMSSPNNSQRFPQNSQTAPSPLRADAPQRRVMFEAYPTQDKRVVYQPQMPPPPHHQYGPYTAHPAR